MKRKVLLVLFAAIMALSSAGALAGCGFQFVVDNSSESGSYSGSSQSGNQSISGLDGDSTGEDSTGGDGSGSDSSSGDSSGSDSTGGEDAPSEDIGVSMLTFTLNADGAGYSVSDCETSATVVEIPATYEGLPVSSIGNSAFSECNSLESIEIPDNVTSIGNSAFEGCTSLAKIEISDSVTSIGVYAFVGCASLESITIPDGVTSIAAYAFTACISLESIIIPDSVAIIGAYTFTDCSSLENVFYMGMAAQWEKVAIASYNSHLTSATIYYYSATQPTAAGNYWHYAEDGVTPVVW